MSIMLADLPLGDLEQHIASLPVDARRITGLSTGPALTGQIASGATIDAGSGFTVASSGTGVYTVTFTTAFAANPTVVATPFRVGGISTFAQLLNLSTASVDIQIHDDTGTARNAAFHFVAFVTV